jgi:hypothetical protein
LIGGPGNKKIAYINTPDSQLVMPGLVPGIHVFLTANKTWMAGTSPAMTWVARPIPIRAGLAAIFSSNR